MNAAVIIIDLQEYFYKLDSLKFENKINPNIKKLLQFAREAKLKIIHVITVYKKDKSNWPESYKTRDTMWCLEGTEDCKIIQNALPEENETVIIKKRFSSFYGTELDEVLQQNKIDTLFIAGYSGDVCVRMTTMDAFNRGYNLFWVSDCIESLFEDYKKSEEYIQNLTKLKVVTIEEMKKSFAITGLHHISMKCKDPVLFEKAVSFYKEVLGFVEERRWTEGVMLKSGTDLARLEIFCNGDGIRELGAVRHFALQTKIVDELAAKVEAAGYEVFIKPKDIVIPSNPEFHARMSFFYGPLGEQVELYNPQE